MRLQQELAAAQAEKEAQLLANQQHVSDLAAKQEQEVQRLEQLMKEQQERDAALNSKTVKKSEKEKARLREEARLEIEAHKRAVEQAQAAH